MPAINLLQNETARDIRYGFVNLKLDTSELVDKLKEDNKTLYKIAQSATVLKKLANAVIVTAYRSDLIPEKLEYQIRSTKSNRILRDENKKPVKYKSGKKAGKNKLAPFTPAQYYRYENYSEDVYEPDYTKDTQIKEDPSQSVTKTYRRKKYKGVLAAPQVESIKKVRKYKNK